MDDEKRKKGEKNSLKLTQREEKEILALQD